MSSLPFVLSDTLKERLRASESAASTSTQLSAALPQPDVQTQASPSPQYTSVPYGFEIITSGAVGYWELGPYLADGVTDYVPILNGFAPHLTATVFYGYILFVVGTLGVDVVYVGVPGVNQLNPDDTAAEFSASGGLTMQYFPVTGQEAMFIGSLDFDVDEDFTWEFWIKTTQSPGAAVRILEQASGGVFPYRIQLLPSGAIRASRSDGTLTAQVDSAEVVNDGEWHYVAVYKDGATLGVATDDNAAATTADTLVGQATPGSTTLLVDGSIAGDGFVGTLDEPALYEYALTPAQRLRRLASIAGEQVPV
jgi:hypothetical protein